MKITGSSRQEQATGQLIHDHRNNMDNFNLHVSNLIGWLRDNSKAINDAGINCSIPYVAVEYFRRDIGREKSAIDAFYIEFQNDFKDPSTENK